MVKLSRVTIIKGLDPIETTVKALESLKQDLNAVLSTEKPILIKPNYITAQHPSTGITTDSRVVEGVVKFLKEHHSGTDGVNGHRVWISSLQRSSISFWRKGRDLEHAA